MRPLSLLFGVALLACGAPPGEEGGEPGDVAPVEGVRRAPVVTSVTVSPNAPARGEEVVCRAQVADPDGDAPVVSYAWSTGAEGPQITVTASEPRRTVLTCTATAVDAVDASLFDAASASVEVGNSPPVVSSVSITPGVARTGDTLTAAVEASDPDGDAVSLSYAWRVDGVVVAGATGSTLGPSAFLKGDAVVLSVTASDGASSSDGVSPPVVIANTAPGAPVVSVTPEDAVEGDALVCTVVTAAADPDVSDGVDVLSYAFSWTVDGAPFSGASDAALSSTVSGEDVGAEELWSCAVVASDGEAVGPAGEAGVLVEALAAGHAGTSPSLGTVRYIPPGSFTMGCLVGRDDVSAGCTTSEFPTRTVTLSTPFWMMESEVTQEMWTDLGLPNPSHNIGTARPVGSIIWWEALEAANAASSIDGLPPCYVLTGCSGVVGDDRTCTGVTVTSASGHPRDCPGWRLPTEAEWEYAARAGTSFPYSGASNLAAAWVAGATSSGSKDVCTAPTPRNAWGLCDMSGNIREWVWDWFASSYAGAATTDPRGPTTGSERVTRGGDWLNSANFARVAARGSRVPDASVYSRNPLVGFRLVRSAP